MSPSNDNAGNWLFGTGNIESNTRIVESSLKRGILPRLSRRWL